ncbi:ubiquitin carboxyl-terminal hydrolase 23 [Nymphaea colorata]|nr:ubiquitin carboxyl-terminal hydrolase 23 [Nymphaea colorata]
MAGFAPNLEKSGNGSSHPSLDLVLPRRIAFHPARKLSDSFLTGDFKLETLNPGFNSQKISLNPSFSALAKTSEAVDAQEIVLDPELTLGIGFKRIGAGLANLGNTCYLNSVLQCLTYTEPLAAYLQSGKHKSSCHIAGFCAMCAIQNHVRSALQSSGKILSPMHLVRNLRSISHSFRASRQEDAHEYMVNLMESMHRCCLPSGVSSETPSAYEKSLVHKIFGGKLRSQVKCTQCSHCSNTFDPFLDLSLQIVKADSLPKALAHFTAVEELDGGQKQYQCARCKEKVRARKQLTIHKAPYVLTIHLKRFGSGEPGRKIDKKVEFGTTLNLKPYVSGPYEGDLKYSLYGVLVHAGWSTHSGHYYCFVRTSSGVWHALDDNRVSQVSEKSVMEQKAYMLFYVFDRKNSNMKKSILQNGVIPGSVNRAVENSWNHNIGVKNGISLSAASMVREVKLHKMGSSSPAVNSLNNSKHAVSELSNLKTNMDTAFGCSHQSAESIKVSSNATISSAGSAKAALNDAINKHASNNRISKQACEEKLATPSNGDSESCVTNSCTVYDNSPDVSKTGTAHVDYVHKSAILSTGDTDSHIPSPKKLLAPNGSVGCQPGGSVGEEKTVDLPRISTQNSEAQLSIDAQATVTNGCSEEALTNQNTICAVLDQKRTTSKQIRKRKYLPMMPTSRGRMFLAALKVQKDYKHKARSQIRQSIAKDILGTKLRSQTGVPEQVHRDPVHAQGMSCQVGVAYKENGYANLGDQSQCDNGSTSIRKRMNRERNMQKTAETNESGDLACVREANGQHKGAVQNKFMDLLSRGLSPIAVARWDDGQASGCDRAKQFQGKLLTSIGYVLDEWDEEYDQGKRKKIKKSQHLAGMGNPFQEIATKKAKLKHTNLEQTRPGHQPLRI